MHVLLVEGRLLDLLRGGPEPEPTVDLHLHRSGVEEPLEKVLGEATVDLSWPHRCLLLSVATRIEDVHLSSVSMRDMPRPAVLRAELAAVWKAQVRDPHPGRIGMCPPIPSHHPEHPLHHRVGPVAAKLWIGRSGARDAPCEEVPPLARNGDAAHHR